MQLVTFPDKDGALPESNPQRRIRVVDVNELKTVTNYNAQAFRDEVIPTGVIDGVNKVFVFPEIPATGSLKLYPDGIRVKGLGVDYTLVAATVTLIIAPISSIAGDYRI